jgi:DNA-directed RNA polymerase specialized sigma24 family protein
MAEDQELQALISRALHGDEAASTELVVRLQPVILRAVRVHLSPRDPLRRLFDSTDICQSVLVRFLARAGASAISFDNPAGVRALLEEMAAAKFIDKRREAAARRRDYRRDEAGGWRVFDEPDNKAGPDQIAQRRELYQEVRRRLSTREQAMAELWMSGHTFVEIAAKVSSNGPEPLGPDAVRMVLKRAFNRVARQVPAGAEG